MKNFYLGADVSKGYSDFMLLDAKKRRIEEDFQLDDTFDGHQKLYQTILKNVNISTNTTNHSSQIQLHHLI